MKYIESTQNKTVKNILLLKDKSKVRKQQGVFIVEGIREVELALQGNYTIESLYLLDDLHNDNEIVTWQNKTKAEVTIINKKVYEKLAYRTTTEGIIAIFKTKNHSLEAIKFDSKNPLILIAEAPEKPGNIGALLRTADASNVDAVFIANPKTDLYNPNIVRSSVGCLFTTNIATGTTQEIIAYLQKHKINMYAAALHKDSTDYTLQNFKKPTAIIVGTEATGLSDEWMEKSKKIIIPMRGKIDSLNVSVSAAILIFEAVRQRN